MQCQPMRYVFFWTTSGLVRQKRRCDLRVNEYTDYAKRVSPLTASEQTRHAGFTTPPLGCPKEGGREGRGKGRPCVIRPRPWLENASS